MGDINSLFNILTVAIRFIGAGICVGGIYELIKSFSDQNPQARTIGFSFLGTGVLVIFIAEPITNFLMSYLPK